jgi:hypothetical protein
MSAASLSAPSRWLPPPLGSLSLLLLLGCLAASVPLRAAEAAGVLRQVVDGGGDGDSGAFYEPFNVTYDHRAVILGGKRRMLVSAGLHYPRATPEVSTALRFWGASTAAAVGRGSGTPRGVVDWFGGRRRDRWNCISKCFIRAAVGLGCSRLIGAESLAVGDGFAHVAFPIRRVLISV